MSKPLRITKKNVYSFLKRSSTNISIDDLELLPHTGINIVFNYRGNSILKVAKSHSARTALLKEAKLLEYLDKCHLPVTTPQLLLAHDKGHYILISRINGNELNQNAVQSLSKEGQKSFAQCIGDFLSFLHWHEFPKDVTGHIEQSRESLAVLFNRSKRKIDFIKENSSEFDTNEWEIKLKGLQGTLEDLWTVTHGDFSLEHIFSIQDNVGKFAVIDFNCVLLFDPSVDFSELFQGLPINVRDLILGCYSTSDIDISNKIELRLFSEEVHKIYRNIRNSIT